MDDDFCSLTELGQHYGVTSHVVGRWLKGLELRTADGKPSPKAFDGGFVAQRPSRGIGTYFWCWHESKTIEVIDEWIE